MAEGDPVQQILRMAEETRWDLIVMGTQGLSRWFTSSVAEQVVRKAACSVLVAKTGGEEPQPA